MSKKLLTKKEMRCLDLLADAWKLYSEKICGNSDTRHQDLTELGTRIKDLEHIIMAQAVARAYPDEFRLAGEAFAED